MTDKWSKSDLYYKIDYEGGTSYFTGYGPEPAENVPDDIRDLWVEVSAKAMDFDNAYQELMNILWQEAKENPEEW